MSVAREGDVRSIEVPLSPRYILSRLPLVQSYSNVANWPGEGGPCNGARATQSGVGTIKPMKTITVQLHKAPLRGKRSLGQASKRRTWRHGPYVNIYQTCSSR